MIKYYANLKYLTGLGGVVHTPCIRRFIMSECEHLVALRVVNTEVAINELNEFMRKLHLKTLKKLVVGEELIVIAKKP